MAEPGSVTRALLEIARDGTDETALGGRICRACVEGLDVDGAGISLLTASSARETLCASDLTMAHVEELQFTLGEGPCVEAAASGRPVLISDIRRAAIERWPMFAAAVIERTAVVALFALPLQLGTINLGVLDLYRAGPGLLGDDEMRDAMRGADAAALLLLGARTDPGDGSGWDHSWSGRAEVHQATGMVVGQLGVSTQDAFARLRGYAFSHDRLLIDVAHEVIARRLRFTEDMD